MGWDSLLAIYEEARTAQLPEGRECPNDGVSLRTGSNGILFCPFDGWRGSAAEAMPTPETQREAGYGQLSFGVDGYGY